PPRPPKPPGPPERMRRDSEADGRKGPIRFYLDKPGDDNGPARFEVRVFRDGDGGPSPDYLINRLHVENAEGEPHVFLYREGKDGKPEKVEGRTEGDESVIELEDGRIHVRSLRGPEPANLKPRRPVPPLPPGDPAKAHRISRVVTLEIDGKQVPVVVEEHFNVEKGPAKDITVRVLPKAPPGTEVWPVPKEKSSGDRGRATRGPEREGLPEEVREEVEKAHREAERQAEKLREESEAVRERAEAIRREIEEAFRERERALEQTIHRLREQLDEARSAEEAAREDEPERRADEERREADEAAREAEDEARQAEDEAREAEDEAREEREEAEESKEQPEENETAAARPAAVGEAVGTESSNSGTYGDLFAILAGAFR
ncbi:MAG TPA: hypothetical protein VF170_04030, partial [Planctomycetaceae bacterium]